MNPRDVGTFDQPNGWARVTGPCGDTIEMRLMVRDGTVTRAAFATDGCDATAVAASVATELAEGKRVPEAGSIGQQDILFALGGLPKDSQHCALLAANTLREAVADHLAMQKAPWKRAYRRI